MDHPPSERSDQTKLAIGDNISARNSRSSPIEERLCIIGMPQK